MQCNRTLSLDALHSQILHEPRKLAVIGSGCSVATEAGAEVSHYYNITQVRRNVVSYCHGITSQSSFKGHRTVAIATCMVMVLWTFDKGTLEGNGDTPF